jgi:hypothetical protein
VVTSFRLNHDSNIVEHHHFDDRVREILFLCTIFVFLCTTFAPSSRSTSTILRCSQLHCRRLLDALCLLRRDQAACAGDGLEVRAPSFLTA